MNHLMITISREYGSGGSLIGPLVAGKLGIPCYDRSALDKLARKRGWDQFYIPAWQEEISSLTLWEADSQTLRKESRLPRHKHRSYYSNERTMFLTQSKLICELAEAGPCVLVGRCADYVLRHWPRCLRVRITADEDSRALRLYNEYFVRSGSLSEKIRLVDRGRGTYYRRCTGRIWGDAQTYHLQLDSGSLGITGCADAILSEAGKI